MSFRHISEALAGVMAGIDIEPGREAAIAAPPAGPHDEEGFQSRSEFEGKDRSPKAPASCDKGGPSPARSVRGRPVLRLIIGSKGMDRAPQSERLPRRSALSSPLVLVWTDHAGARLLT